MLCSKASISFTVSQQGVGYRQCDCPTSSFLFLFSLMAKENVVTVRDSYVVGSATLMVYIVP